jgi:D-alanyl-D-alanine-carboxypeptidase/D-alanyl-D-alanine-endopeptidase
MPSRRSVLAATAIAGMAAVAPPAYAEGGDLRSLVDGWQDYLLNFKGYQAVGVGAFSGRRQYAASGDVIFQLGSITKTFTALALAIADRAGRLSVDDPLRGQLPSNFPVPTRGSKPITLAHLASHISGMDRLC